MNKGKILHKYTAEKQLERAEKELKHAEQSLKLFKMIAEQSVDGIIIADLRGRIQFVNKAWAAMHDCCTDELINTKVTDYFFNEGNSISINEFIKNVMENDFYEDEIIHKKKDGSLFPALTAITLLRNEENIPVGFVENSHDISERKASEKALRDSEAKFRCLYENALVGMITTDDSGAITAINELAIKMLGFTGKEDLVNKINIRDICADNNVRESFFGGILEKGKISNFEIQFTGKQGGTFWAEASFKYYKDEKIIDGIIIDISKRKNAEERIYNLTYYDQLTKLPNKEYFKTYIQNEINKNERRGKTDIFAVMCLGINGFKSINNIYGPETGDVLLAEIAHRLEKSLYNKDVVSRFDGDKFMILFSDIASRDDAGQLVKKTRDIFTDSIKVEENQFTISVSIGICLYPEDGVTPDIIIKNSEAAMFTAKEQSNLTHFFDPKLNEEIITRFQIEKELKTAISNKEFIAYYQPKVTYDGNIVGMESLIRWVSPVRGLVPPVQFIPIAEKNSMIIGIGNIILEQSCLQNKNWQDIGCKSIRVSVNLSPIQFSQKTLVNDIEKILIKTGLDPKWLEVEITETGIFKNEKESIEKMNEIHSLGIAISIDDFGTGYSSLSKLKDYPIDTLKIDKSIIDGIPFNKTSSIITTTIIDLAHNLGFNVIAEGVEKKEQLDFLVFHKCDQFQGYYFSKPVTPKEFEKKII